VVETDREVEQQGREQRGERDVDGDVEAGRDMREESAVVSLLLPRRASRNWMARKRHQSPATMWNTTVWNATRPVAASSSSVTIG
jgi:hypothetical protein